MKTVWFGLGLTVAVTAILTLVFGAEAVIPGLAFGGLATLIQFVAELLVKPVLKGEFKTLMKRWAIGMVLRVAGETMSLTPGATVLPLTTSAAAARSSSLPPVQLPIQATSMAVGSSSPTGIPLSGLKGGAT